MTLSLARMQAIWCHLWPGLPHAALDPWFFRHACEHGLLLISCRSSISLTSYIFLGPTQDPLFVYRKEGLPSEEGLEGPLHLLWVLRVDIRICYTGSTLWTHTGRWNSLNLQRRQQSFRKWLIPTQKSRAFIPRLLRQFRILFFLFGLTPSVWH